MSDERKHIPAEILFEYADNPDGTPECEHIERHVAACADCWNLLSDYRTFGAALRDEETWWLAEEIASGHVQQSLRELAARREAEDAEAERMLRPLLESRYRFAYANIARKKRFHTGGVVRVLCDAAWTQCHNDPRFALVLAETASVIAEALADDYYPASGVDELRGRAWKEYSTACQYLSEYRSGFDALDRAERAFRRLPDPGVYFGTIDMARACLFWEQQKYADALPLARTAAQRFAERRDMKRYFESKELEAIILHRLGDLAAAREIYQTAFNLADSIGDAEMKARAAKHLAIACRESGDIGSASKLLSIALQLYQGLDQPVMILITRWSIARLSLAAGNAAEAARRLPSLIAEMESVGVLGHAAEARLDLAEALLQLGRFDEVIVVCAGLGDYFRRAKMLTGALTAAAYLKEAAVKRTLTVHHLQHVRTYLSALERAPDLPFAPPPERS